MPNLPTLTVTQEQLDVLLQVFGNQEVYLQWLGQEIAAYVAVQGRQFYANQMETNVQELISLFEGLGTT
jgi:hypothetical protein